MFAIQRSAQKGAIMGTRELAIVMNMELAASEWQLCGQNQLFRERNRSVTMRSADVMLYGARSTTIVPAMGCTS